jgi:hypothetical protein
MRALMRKRGLPRDAGGALGVRVGGKGESQRTTDYATRCPCEYRSVHEGLVWGFAEGGVGARAYWFIEPKTRPVEEYLYACVERAVVSLGRLGRLGRGRRCRRGRQRADKPTAGDSTCLVDVCGRETALYASYSLIFPCLA